MMSNSPLNKVRHTIRFYLLRRLPTCKDIMPIMSESMERPLSVRENATLKLHLWVCVWCEWYLEHLQTIRKSLQLSKNEDAIESSNLPNLTDEARNRIKRTLAEKSK
jgi:hypothetical protein